MTNPFSGDPRTVRRPDYTPRSKRPCYDVYRVEPGKNHDLVILSRKLECVLVHAVGARTQPCTGEGGACWLSHAEHAIRWQGWLWVRRPFVRELRTVTITALACEDAPLLLHPSEELRGRKLTLWRHDRRICSRMHAAVDRPFSVSDALPEVPDMISHLGNLWSAPPRSDRGKDCPQAIQDIRDRFNRNVAPV